MSDNAEFDINRALDIILNEGQDCECTYRGSCNQCSEMWCKHVARINNDNKNPDYRDLSLGPCMYRDQPGCCWILGAVENLADDYLDRLNIRQAPVPSELIKCFDEKRNKVIEYLPLKNLHGATWLLDDEWIVQINQNDSPQVQRFTLFHEAFHIACRSFEPEFKRKDLKRKPFRDVLADHFATCILMPKDWIRDYWSILNNARDMAEIFNVSLPAISHRLAQLNLVHETRLPSPA